MFSMCSELTPRARILDTRIPQLMQPCMQNSIRIKGPNNHSDALKRGPCLAWMGNKQLRSPGAGLLKYQVLLGANLGSQREGDL